MLSQVSDPLVDLAGRWTTTLADAHLPVRELAGARHECVDGRLVIGPWLGAAESFAMASLATLLIPAAEAAGRHVYGRVNLTFGPALWIQPDITVLHTLPAGDAEDRWVPAGYCTMAVEVLPRGGPRRTPVDRSRRCAAGGVPYFLRVEVGPEQAVVELLTLTPAAGRYARTARASGGHRLRSDLPFPIDLDPADLLP
ncbi:Uma2 family endonuclease [Micromonospora auratinigra]|uniref:Putative restriction endonuclease n=1 Tax=Micromonospora auratinigra TaxID=261654 RepID=A0A1A8ZZH4_9ACTN|nr:Uma2 family endonuclease [Micromonospora auratinigra]SBT49291.1 Putative restriction endonuclease [Micromonospora auratinigra]